MLLKAIDTYADALNASLELLQKELRADSFGKQFYWKTNLIFEMRFPDLEKRRAYENDKGTCLTMLEEIAESSWKKLPDNAYIKDFKDILKRVVKKINAEREQQGLEPFDSSRLDSIFA